MKIKKAFFVLASIILTSLILSSSAVLADRNSDSAKRSLKVVKSETEKLSKYAGKPGVGKALEDSGLYRGMDDSDNDGIPNAVEDALGNNGCNADNDGDGLEDGREYRAGSDSNDHNESEAEVKGLVTALTASTITVGGNTFTVTAATRFKRYNNFSEVQVGHRVEVDGRLVSGILEAHKIERK